MKRKFTPATFIILMFILIGNSSLVKAQCSAINFNSFSVSSDKACAGSKVNINVVTDNQNSVLWNFGNGLISTKGNTFTKYVTPGKYYIKCLISSECGNDTVLRDTIIITASSPYFALNATPNNTDSVCLNENAFFNIAGDFKSIYWSFDNGHTGSKNEVKEKFSTFGDHPYTLTLTDFCNNDTTVYRKTVVRNKYDFSGNLNFNAPDTVCSKAEMSYSGDAFQDLLWTFGDGDSLHGDQNIFTHFYQTDGRYPVTLTATDYCMNKITLTDTVVVKATTVPIITDFSKMSDTICPGDVFFIMSAALRADEYTWDMNDGTIVKGDYLTYKYTSPGMHYFSLTVSNTCGLDTTVTDSIYVSNNFKTNFDIYGYQMINNEACFGDNFTIISFPYGKATFLLGDGRTVKDVPDSLVNFSKTPALNIGLTSFSYKAIGTYTVQAEITSGCGVKDTIEVGKLDVLASSAAFAYVSIDNLLGPGINFSYVNKPTTFYVGVTSNYFIDYGDGITNTFSGGSYTKDKHTYTAEGTYNVTLIATNTCGESDSTGITIYIIKDPNGYTGVSENTVESMNIEAFPNPTNDVVTFKFDRNISENTLFSIYDLQGQLVHQQNITNTNKVDFDFSQFSAGLYIVGFISETQNTSTKITLIK